jgi:polysaccharide deacetylase family protein (PEP-CTERM system associated)
VSVSHHLTVDVEEFFHASAMEPFMLRQGWDGHHRRSPYLVGRLLDQLATADVKATFFVLAWLAEREPDTVRAIARAGHEIASHGWDHRKVTSLTPEEFREDVHRSREVLQEISGQCVSGYRAPSFSILPGSEWALDVLLDEGYRYDSSMVPVRVHPGYGYPKANPDPHRIVRSAGTLLEIPPATLPMGPLNLPAGGGAYLRFFPVGLARRALKAAEGRGVPGTLYMHPWELDKDMPAFRAPWLTRLRMRGGIRGVERKLAVLTSAFRFRTMGETVREMDAAESRSGTC